MKKNGLKTLGDSVKITCIKVYIIVQKMADSMLLLLHIKVASVLGCTKGLGVSTWLN